MEILTEFDGFQEALKKVKMDEAVLPYCNGRLVDDAAFNKTQKILNCPEMISAHKYLYNLDMDQLTEEEVEKIDQLYKLGCDRGFIVDDLTDWDAPEQQEEKPVEEPKAEEPAQKPIGGTLFKAKVPCWTVIYSATSKDGEIKTGEAYSNALSASAAKADVNAKLSRIGYSNISILAIEATDAYCSAVAEIEEQEVEENDMLRNRPHNAHINDPRGVVAEDEEETETDVETEEETDSEDGSEEESTEETSTEEDTTDDSADNEDDSGEEESNDDSDDNLDDETSDDEEDSSGSDDDSSDDSTDDEESDISNEDSDSSEDDEESNNDEEDKEDDEESDDEESDSDDEEKEELDANKKSELKDKYRKTFKNTLVKCKFDSSFNDLTLEQKVKFFTELSKAWDKNEPNEFMTDKEIEQLNNVAVKEDND